MPSMLPAIDYGAQMTRPGPFAGFVVKSENDLDPISANFKGRAVTQQVSTSTLTDGFNGTRDLGVYLDGALIRFDNAANVAAWVVGMNLIAGLSAKGVLSYSAPTLTFTGTDGLPHTLAETPAALATPDDPTLTLSAWTLATAATSAVANFTPGRGMTWLDPTIRKVEAPRANSTELDFVGMLALVSVPPTLIASAYGVSEGVIISGQAVRLHRKGVMFPQPGIGATITKKYPVYMGRIGTEAGYFYQADDGGNTRLLIPHAKWLASGTGVAGMGIQAQF